LILILMFCFALASAGESVGPVASNVAWRELRHNANAAEDSADFQAAERYYLQAIQAAVDGGDPVGLFAVAEELGQFYWKRGNEPAALTYLRMAVMVVRRISPADSQQKGDALSNLGVVLSDTGSLNEGEESLLEALRVFQNLDSHESVAATYDALALVEICRGKYNVAEEREKTSLAILKERGLENMTTARCLDTLARIYATVGRIQDAEKVSAHAEAIFRRNLPSASVDLIQCLDTKATVLFQQQRVSEAERLWKSAIESARTVDPPLIILDPPYHLSELYLQTKPYRKAQDLLEQLLHPQPNCRPNALSRALIEGQLAYAVMQQHMNERADALFQSAVSTLAASPENESLGYALMCLRYAKLKAQHKDWREATLYVERGVKIESDVIPRSFAMAEALELSAQIYGKLSRRDEAKDCLTRARAIRAVIENPQPSSTVDVGVLAAEMR
jgi:tetratricopeptide (TPR) repeat protein